MADNGVFMSTKDSIKFQVITRFIDGSISRDKASELLQMSQRSVSRLASKVRKLGVFGVKHGNMGKSPNKRYSDELQQQVIELLCREYFDFNVKHFHEILVSQYQLEIPYKTLWRWCKQLKLVKNPRVKRRKKKEYRHRMPNDPGLPEGLKAYNRAKRPS